MGYTLVHRDGRRSHDPPLADVLRLLGELGSGDGQVAVAHDAGWTLTVRGDGTVVFGNPQDPRVPDRHARDLPPSSLAELAEAVAVGHFYETLEHEWHQDTAPH